MSISNKFHVSQFDLTIVSGHNLTDWPSIGVKTLSRICSDNGLKVGWVGGEDLKPIGILPSQNHGGILFTEDKQKRIHRIETKSLVRFQKCNEIPQSFIGSFGPGLLPGHSAKKLLNAHSLIFKSNIAILGSGNKALQFGIQLLEKNQNIIVYIIESKTELTGKRYSGWEVFKRRFESLGGRWIEGTPLSLMPLHANLQNLFELKCRDSKGVRVLEVERVISFGPFEKEEGYKEYPIGSLLFEVKQTAEKTKNEDVDGYLREKSLSELLGVKISKILAPHSQNLSGIDLLFKRAKKQWKSLFIHEDEFKTFYYSGKFLSTPELNKLKEFSGVPKNINQQKASIECIETIECNLCENECPESAIKISRQTSTPTFLVEDACTACGKCISICPSKTPVLLKNAKKESTIEISFYCPTSLTFSKGSTVELLNRRGENIGLGRTVLLENNLLTVEAPIHLQWEARAFRKPIKENQIEPHFKLEDESLFLKDKVSILLNDEKRFVRKNLTITETLCETGHFRGNDQLYCNDGSCGRCSIEVDGLKQLACKTNIRAGMQIKFEKTESIESDAVLCPCLSISEKSFRESVRNSKVSNPLHALNLTECGTGVCHGQNCLQNALQILKEENLSFERFIDWRFPWIDWKFGGSL